MTLFDIVLIVAKVLLLIGFFSTMAAVGIWADRRQSAMVQDRVGPNRAVILLPSNIVRVIVLLPPTVLGAIALRPALPFFPAFAQLRLPYAFQILAITTQLAILVGWMSLALLAGIARRSGPINAVEAALAPVDPRSIFYAGVALPRGRLRRDERRPGRQPSSPRRASRA